MNQISLIEFYESNFINWIWLIKLFYYYILGNLFFINVFCNNKSSFIIFKMFSSNFYLFLDLKIDYTLFYLICNKIILIIQFICLSTKLNHNNSSKINDTDIFISTCFIIFTAYKIFYYWNSTDYLVYLLLIVSFYLINELIIFIIRLFSIEIILTI